MEDEQEQRRRKVEAGRAKLASFRQRKTKGDSPNPKKKTAKRKGSAVHASVQEAASVAAPNSELPRGATVFESQACSNTLDGTGGASAAQEQEDCDLDVTDLQGQQQPQPQPPQTAHSLELEALRLSLNNMHTAQLELMQANLQKEKETALTELREMLNGRRAQELALLQSRQQCELELMREQHAREKEAMELRSGQETAELKEKLRLEMEKNVQMIETLKQDWESERELCLENLRKELSAKHQSEMETLQNQFQKELSEQKAELEKIFQAKHEVEVSLKNLEAQHQEAIKKLQEDLQSEHCQYLQDLELKFREKEKAKELELETLQASYEDLKAQSQEEIRQLWSQLESMRSNRDSVNGSWEPLLAQASHLEDLEHLRADFSQQQQQQERAQHEAELEHLRVYFEKKLKDAEKTYQEDLTVFQQRLQEAREDSLESAEISSSCMFPEETSEREGKEPPHPLHLQLEQPKVQDSLVEDCQEKLSKAEEKIQQMKQEFQKKEAEWELSREDLKREAEDRLASMFLELQEKAESEKLSIINRFEQRESSMRHLQDQQAAQIVDLERSLLEQQGHLRQLEEELTRDDTLPCSRCGQEPSVAQDEKNATLLREKEDCALQLLMAQNRFLEERKEIMEKFAKEQDAFLRDAQEKHSLELQLLQQGHQQQLLALRVELETKHHSELSEQLAALESKQQSLLETQVAELQVTHNAEMSALEKRHRSNLDELESCYVADVQTLRDEHRQALERLQVELAEQLRKRDSSHREILTQELEKLKLKHTEELQSVRDSLGVNLSAQHMESGKGLAADLPGAHQQKDQAVALHSEGHLLQEDGGAASGSEDAEGLLRQAVPRDLGDAHTAEIPKSQAEVAEPRELQVSQDQVAQVRDKVFLLSRELEECRSELEQLQQRRERENQEGATLICMLRADVDLAQSEGKALRDALRRLLDLFGETLKAAVTLKSRISERAGLLLDHEDATDAGDARLAAAALGNMWSDEGLLEIDRTLPEGAETSSVCEISSHVCESFFISPENTLECEQPIRRVFQSLGTAVEGLLEMALDSSKQLEEARQLHRCVEREFRHRNEEVAQAVQKQQELLERLREESVAKDGLALELHTAEGLLEGFKVEKADLQEALGKKEDSERQLILELEDLRKQLQQAARELLALKEENAVLWNQKETCTNEAREREAALQKEVDSLTRDQWESRKQSEKDRATLLSQMRVLESELEDQLVQHRGCAQLAEEVATLKQQLAALDKHLRSQRQFMDEQAAEREHEREEFQQEIQRLEGRLRQAARPQPAGARDSQVELLQEKLREKLDGFNELVIKKDFADQQLLIQEEEIKRLEETNASIQRQMAQLQEELEKQKKSMEELKEREILKQERTGGLLLTPVLRSRLDEAGCLMFSQGSSSRGPEAQLDVMERTLLQHENEVAHSRNSEIEELRAVIENLQENQRQLQKDKAEEIEQLHEVIEKLQHELSLMGPKVHEVSDPQAGSLHSELSCLGAEGLGAQALRHELQAAQAAKEVFGQLLADQAHGHSQALEALQRRLQDAEEVAAGHLAELERRVALREAEVEAMASQLREFEAALKAKEAIISKRDSEMDAVNQWKVSHSLELEAILLALAHFRHALGQQTLVTPGQPPELRQLRMQCARLSHQLQALYRRFLKCQLDRHQPHIGSVGCAEAQAEHEEELEQEGVSCGLALAPHSRGAQAKEQHLEDCLGNASLLARARQLQEELDHRVHSVDSRDTSMETSGLQQPDLSENGSSDRCHNGGASKPSPPDDVLDTAKTTWDVIDIIKNQDLLVQIEMPDFPTQEKLTSQGGPFSSQSAVHRDSLLTEEAEPQKDTVRALDLSLWSSPEVLRKDSSLEPQHSLPLTPGMGPGSLHSVDISSPDWTDPLLQADVSGLLCYPGKPATGQAPLWAVAPSAEKHHAERAATEKDVEDFIVTSFGSQESLPSPSHELARRSDGSGKRDGPDTAVMLTLGSEGSETPTTDRVAAAATVPLSRRLGQSPGAMKEKEVNAKEMKALLQMVFDESHQILALSESQDPSSALSKGEPRDPLDGFPRDSQALSEVTTDRGEKESLETHLTWSEELLRVIQEVFAREQEKAELQPRPPGSNLGDCNSLVKRLEKVLQEQGDLQKAQEHLCLPDRSSLLAEIQALRAQLRMTHLQNQEKLQQLCAALTSTEARGSQREHQLRRQVELLAYKVEQEKCIASDLQKTLSEEQEAASEVRQRLTAEQSAVQDLKSELHACKQENTSLLESLDKVQQEVLRLRYGHVTWSYSGTSSASAGRAVLDGKENELKVVLEELESERGKGQALQAQQEEQQLRFLQREGQSSRALEELKISLEKQLAQNNQLCVALKHERAAKDNLQKELQIEASRCEALLAQEKGQLSELQKSLEAERSRSLELSEALQHERLLTEQLSRNAQEACARQDTQAQHALLRKLKAEKARALELEAMLEKVQKQAAHTQQQLESQAQERCVELRREKEVSGNLRSAVDALRSHKQELGCCLEREREKAAWLQAELEQLSARVKEQDARKDARRMERRSSRADLDKRKWQRDKETLRELEIQRQRDEHKIEQLQRVVRELRWKEEVPGGNVPCRGSPGLASLERDQFQEQQQELEKIRQQLLCAAGLLTSFTNHTVDRTIKDWTSSNEKAVSSLMRTLEELKSELSMPTSFQKKMAAELQVQLMNELLSDNDALTKAVGIATREKAELCRTVSRLEKTLKHHTQKGCILNRQSKSSLKQDGTDLQSSLRHSDPDWHSQTSGDTNTCNIKMEKLYLHYLRAESFRKALIYQKKYLLLLIGGFQDSEQETLSMIAHLGVFPSKADKKITTSRPFTKFRTAVRVVIAVLRLRFLVKKWQEVDRKGALIHGKSTRHGHRTSQRQRSPSGVRASLPTRDTSSSGYTKDSRPSPRSGVAILPGKERSTSTPSSKLERSLTASQDPDHSLTEYIHRLEMIQQRLGGLPPDSTQKSCHQKIKQ
ncbi:pericentrin isoform X3 [Apodemus sylvaticus]|uniref:pericentrin isoform X3 n=1 Tax=Apodemus sylvaticus TaxID=10129 RepID=UPI002244B2FD|nr:pericentrin isoform X3 [Apodemus sylvaticus]